MIIGRASKNLCEAEDVKETRGVTSQVTVNTSTHLVWSVLPLRGLQSSVFFMSFLPGWGSGRGIRMNKYKATNIVTWSPG